jgi:transposase/DNA-directed RNA polymerase subunit RPC12/RpoP
MRKWGEKFFTICAIVDGIHSLKEANRLETFWIKKLGSCDRSVGYNLSTGGEGIHDPTGEIRKKLSKATKSFLDGVPEKNPAFRHDVPTEELLEMRRQGLSVAKMAEKFGVSITLVYRRFKKLGVPSVVNLSNIDEEVRRLYVEERYTSTETAKILGVSNSKVYNSLTRQEIKLRPMGSRPRLAIKEKKKCPGCRETKSMSEYHRNSRSTDGHGVRCKECDSKDSKKYKKERKRLEENGLFVRRFPEHEYISGRTKKKCSRCKAIFALEKFTKDKSSPDGRGAYCPECRHEINAEKWSRRNKAPSQKDEAELSTVVVKSEESC